MQPRARIERAFWLAQKRDWDGPGPGDVVCYLTDYATREKIIRRAWCLGPCDFLGAEVSVLPELSEEALPTERPNEALAGPSERTQLLVLLGYTIPSVGATPSRDIFC